MRSHINHSDMDPNLLQSPLSPVTTSFTSRSGSESDRSIGTPQATSSPKTSLIKPRKRFVKKDNFKIALINCQSINNKIAEFHTFLSSTDPDIVLGTESWLRPEVLSCEVFPEDYSVYRKDRKPGDKIKGGGVFILARKDFITSEIQLDSESEFIFIQLQLKDQQNVKIGCVYRPPWTDEEYMKDLGNVLSKIDPQHKGNIWLGGDFNLPKIDWTDTSVLPSDPTPKISQIFLDTIDDYALTQVVDQPTRRSNILDLFLTTNPTLINRVTTSPPLTAEADHDITFIDINSRAFLSKRTPSPRFMYKKADWDSMRERLKTYKLPNAPVQIQWDHLESTIIGLMKKFIPCKTPRAQKHKPWITREVIQTIHRRNRAFTEWKNSKSTAIHEKFIKLRSECQKKIRKIHQDYLDSILNLENTSNDQGNDKNKVNKRFWSFIKANKKDSCSVAPLRSEGVLISDAKGKANVLNKQYCSVFTKDEPTALPSKGPSTAPPLPDITVTENGVLSMLKKLEPNKAAGPDMISPRVLKELADPLSKPLAMLFQHSISSGTVPRQWKTATVSPVFKKGDRNDAANYRPVSLTAVCCKMCEHIIAKSIVEHMEQNDLLSDFQHGFRKERSCETQLITFVDELAKSLCDGNEIDIAVMDFSKAFDVVPHRRLLYKLSHYGVQGNTLTWIKSFLSNRSQRVVVDGEYSDTAPVTSGVPQGSVLGPILFLLFINDMPDCVQSCCRLFADDSIIYRKVNNDEDATILQNDLDALHKWETDWGMQFNPSKCQILHVSKKKQPSTHTYQIKGSVLETVHSATYLGVEFSSDLAWHKQCNKVAAKGNKILGFVKRNIKTTSASTKEYAYKMLVRPTVEYASSVWSPHQETLKYTIERVQRRAARYVTRRYQHSDSVTAMVQQLKWDTLEQRRLKGRVTMGYRVVHRLVKISDAQLIPSTAHTRGHNQKFRQLPARTNYYKHTFFPSVVPLWNALPDHVVSATTLDAFKERLADVQLS